MLLSGEMDEFAAATLPVTRRQVEQVDRKTSFALTEGEAGNFPASLIAEQPFEIRFPVIFRLLTYLFH
jgi:hypothetical protein